MDKLALYELLKKIVVETAPNWGCPSNWGLTDDPNCMEDWDDPDCEECWRRAIAKAETEEETAS